jgi:hypothetical protein
MWYKSIQYFLFLTVIIIFSCSDPASIGSELLTEDQANLQFTDQVEVTGKTITGTAVQTYSPFVSLQLPIQLLGNYEDPIMGTSKAGIYTQVALGTQDRPGNNIFKVDSFVLSLAYDTLDNSYGDLSQPFGLEVRLLEEDMVNIDDYFSNNILRTVDTLLGSAEFTPSIGDQIMLKDYTGDEPIDTVVDSHIRIKLNPELALDIIKDTLLFEDNTVFQERFKGLHIEPTLSSPGILSLDFASSLSKLTVYYTTGKGDNEIPQEYQFDFNSGNARSVTLAHDYESSIVAPYLKNDSDSLLFVQGMAGVNIQLDFPDISSLKGVVINKAELELTVANIEADTLYPTSEQLVITTEEGGSHEIISDVRSALFAQEPIRTSIFGGIPVKEEVNGQTVTKYRLNLSSHFQKIIDGELQSNSINITSGTEQTSLYFQIKPKAVDPARTVFYGPNHPEFPLKLNLTYTKL